MEYKITKCKVCGSEMTQGYVPVDTKCDICGRNMVTNFECKNGHHMCNYCRFDGVLDDLKRICMHTKSRNPIEIGKEIMNTTNLPILGCKHYFLTALTVYTAYKNAGGKVDDFEKTMNTIYSRILLIQTSQCKLGSVCGIPSSVGRAFQVWDVEKKDISEITRIANSLSGYCMSKLVNPNWDGNRECCIRNSIISTVVASKFLNDYYWSDIELPSEIKCEFSEGNPRCNKEKCRLYNGMKLEKLNKIII